MAQLEAMPAREGDEHMVAQVHLQAMENNELLHAQFPCKEALDFLRQWLEKDTLEHIHSKEKGVLVTKDTETSEIASFVKWVVHRNVSDEQPDEDEEWPSFCRSQYLDSYADITANVRKLVMGTEPYYRESAPFVSCPWANIVTSLDMYSSRSWHLQTDTVLDVTFLCTNPRHGRKGAASGLLRQVQRLAAEDGIAVVLESTMNAVTFYQKLGFQVMRSLDMMLPPRGSSDPTELYEERCMVWKAAADGKNLDA